MCATGKEKKRYSSADGFELSVKSSGKGVGVPQGLQRDWPSFFSVIMLNNLVKSNLGFVWFPLPGHSPSLRDIKA